MDFEGEYTMRTASNQQSYEPDTVYPDAVLNIARDSASVFQLKRKWEKTPPMLNLTPDFQRGLVWKPKQKSELIESILMGIPLPLIYVKEDEKGVYVWDLNQIGSVKGYATKQAVIEVAKSFNPVASPIANLGEVFVEWVGEDAFGIDQREVTRNANKMQAGAYDAVLTN